MKKFAYLSLTAALLVFSGCSEEDLMVDENPNTITYASYYQNKEQALSAVTAAYSSLNKRGFWASFYPHVVDGRSDEGILTPNATGLSDVVPVCDFTLNAGNQVNENLWRFIYEGIFRSNVAMTKIAGIDPNNTDLDAALQARLVAEAKFLRAFYYFHAVRLYGEEIPLITEPAEIIAETNPTPAAPGQVFDQIIQDLQEVQGVLPLNTEYAGQDRGRATQGAATALLGKVYLFRASPFWDNEPSYYQQAADEFKKIIDQQVGDYGLMDAYRLNFTDEQENNRESLFEVQFAPANNNPWGADNDGNNNNAESNHRAQSNGMIAGKGARWWNGAATQKLHDEYEVGDPRLHMTLWAEDGALYVDGADGQDTLSFEEIGWPSGLYGWRKYEWDSQAEQLANSLGFRFDGINMRVIRYADVLLMYAEALHQLGRPDAEVAPFVNQVRARATNPVDEGALQVNLPYNTQNPVTQGVVPPLPTVEALIASNDKGIQNMMDAIMHERLVELGGEQHRWDDIVRWNIVQEVVTAPAFAPGRSEFLPIPQQELDTNPNMEPNRAN